MKSKGDTAMIRECSLDEISDGRTYRENDMVKADTAGCDGCFKCCTGMGQSIILDPFDVWILKCFAGDGRMTFEQLMAAGKLELNMADGLILPNLSMGKNDKCSFLNDSGRCMIHSVRPSICRLFPLGRVYDEAGNFSYFLQTGECVKENRAKIKVKKWIQIKCPEQNRSFIINWHDFIKNAREKMHEYKKNGRGEKLQELAMYVLNEFYVSDIVTDSSDDGIAASYDDEKYISRVYEILCDKIHNAREKIEAF